MYDFVLNYYPCTMSCMYGMCAYAYTRVCVCVGTCTVCLYMFKGVSR